MTFLDHLQWRHATKAFDVDKPINNDKVDQILEAITLAPTSFGLQPFRVFAVTDAELKGEMAEIGWNQPQWTTASHVLVFVVDLQIQERIDELMTKMNGGSLDDLPEGLQQYKGMAEGFLAAYDDAQKHAWAAKQAYIALGFGLAAAAELEVDSCPMEGFVPEDMDNILELPAHQKSVVAMTIGTRVEDPHHPKVRMDVVM